MVLIFPSVFMWINGNSYSVVKQIDYEYRHNYNRSIQA